MNVRRLALFAGVLVVFAALVVSTLTDTISPSLNLLHRVHLGLDLQGGFSVELQVRTPQGSAPSQEQMNETIAVLQNRVNGLGVSEPYLAKEGTDRVRIELPGVKNQAEARRILVTTAHLEFRSAPREDPSSKVLLSGADLKSASVGTDSTGRPAIETTFADPKKFAEVTRTYLGKPIYIYLDQQLLSSPVIQDVIQNGQGQITGQFTTEEARNLAALLQAGALPTTLQELSSNSVGPTLGIQAFQHTLIAAAVALAIVFLFMIVYYRIPGLIADIGVLIYGYLLIAAFVAFGVTLTLPGIAAMVLGIGMAVDANVITDERLKEELKRGRDLEAALQHGFRRSLMTVIDSNVTTLLAGAVLFGVGTGEVRGFGLTLIITIVIHLLSNVLITRWLLHTFAGILPLPRLYGQPKKMPPLGGEAVGE